MLVGIKNVSKLIGISIIACCAVLVCTMFLNFYFDIQLIESELHLNYQCFFIMLRFLPQKSFAL